MYLDMNVRGGWNLNELNEISRYHNIIKYNQYIYYFGASKSSDPLTPDMSRKIVTSQVQQAKELLGLGVSQPHDSINK